MKVLVTGATGFMAQHLLPALGHDGHEVVAVGHDRSRIRRDGVAEVVEADLRDSAAIVALPEADAVVHLAQANVPFPEGASALFDVNTLSTARLLELAYNSGSRHFVYASSGSVYGLAGASLSEDDPLLATDFYSATKIASERLVRAYAGRFATTVLRLVAPYGPGQRNRLVPRLVERVREGRAIVLNKGGRPRMNPIYIDDVVEVIRAALLDSTELVLNVAGDEPVSIAELGRLIGDAAGREPVFEVSATEVVGDMVCDNTRMHALLGGRTLVTLHEGLARTLKATRPVPA